MRLITLEDNMDSTGNETVSLRDFLSDASPKPHSQQKRPSPNRKPKRGGSKGFMQSLADGVNSIARGLSDAATQPLMFLVPKQKPCVQCAQPQMAYQQPCPTPCSAPVQAAPAQPQTTIVAVPMPQQQPPAVVYVPAPSTLAYQSQPYQSQPYQSQPYQSQPNPQPQGQGTNGAEAPKGYQDLPASSLYNGQYTDQPASILNEPLPEARALVAPQNATPTNGQQQYFSNPLPAMPQGSFPQQGYPQQGYPQQGSSQPSNRNSDGNYNANNINITLTIPGLPQAPAPQPANGDVPQQSPAQDYYPEAQPQQQPPTPEKGTARTEKPKTFLQRLLNPFSPATPNAPAPPPAAEPNALAPPEKIVERIIERPVEKIVEKETIVEVEVPRVYQTKLPVVAEEPRSYQTKRPVVAEEPRSYQTKRAPEEIVEPQSYQTKIRSLKRATTESNPTDTTTPAISTEGIEAISTLNNLGAPKPPPTKPSQALSDRARPKKQRYW